MLSIFEKHNVSFVAVTKQFNTSTSLPFTEGPKATVASKYVLTEHLWNYLQSYAKKHREMGHGFGFGLFGPEDAARTLSARYHKDGSEISISCWQQQLRAKQ